MKKIVAFVVFFILVIVGGVLLFPTRKTPTVPTPPPEASILDQVNQERIKAGKPQLTLDPKLNQAAQAKADDQVTRNYWDHKPPTGESAFTFLNAQYPQSHAAGENLSRCTKSNTEVVQAWVNSPHHYANMIGDYDGTGVAQKVNPQDANCTYTVMYFIKY